MRKFSGLSTILILMLNMMLVFQATCLGNASSRAKVLAVNGEAQYLKAGSTEWQKITLKTVLEEGDTVKTGPNATVNLECMGNAKTAELLVRHKTEFVFTKFRHDSADKIDNTLLMVGIGSVLVKANKLVGASKFEIKTPTSIVGIRGTIFEVHVSSLS